MRTMKLSKKILTVIDLITSYIIFVVSLLIPKSKKTWIFIGWHRNINREIFADNSKYLFLYCQQNIKDKKIIWIGQDKQISKILKANGLLSYPINSLTGIYYSLRARYTFIDAFMNLKNWRYSGNSRIIQLWHGKGMKKTGHGSPYSLKRYNRFLFPQLFANFYRLIASSEQTADLMASTFKVAREKILITGLPRNDIFSQKINGSDIDVHHELSLLLKRLRTNGASRIMFYAPTFRPNGSNPFDIFDFSILDRSLRESGDHLVVSLHPKFATKKKIIETFTNIHLVAAGYDLYPLLAEFDCLITDYSSLYVDFLLIDKPIIFFTYDIDNYRQTMGLHEEFEKLTPGPHSETLSGLIIAIKSTKRDHWQAKREAVRKILFDHVDGNASKRIVELLRQKENLSN